MQTTNYSRTALSYAQAVLELATQHNAAVDIGAELTGIREIIENDESFRMFLGDPSIGHVRRAAVLERTFKGRLSPLVYDALQVISLKNRLSMLPEIAGAYEQLLDQQQGKVDVELTVAAGLSDGELANVQQKISNSLGRDAVVHQYIDDSIIGGMVLRIHDQLIDGSVKTQLQQMKEKMLRARPK